MTTNSKHDTGDERLRKQLVEIIARHGKKDPFFRMHGSQIVDNLMQLFVSHQLALLERVRGEMPEAKYNLPDAAIREINKALDTISNELKGNHE